MRGSDLLNEWGRIVKGVNTTPDVDTHSISREAGKFGFKVDKDGKPPTLNKKVKGKSTNVLFNLGLAESKTIKVCHTAIMDNDNAGYILVKNRKCVARGMKNEMLKLHEETPGSRVWLSCAKVGDLLESDNSFTDYEMALMEGGHSIEDLDKPTPSIKERAQKHNVSTSHILKQLEMGIEAEYEHTSDFDIAKEIALDHIAEDPNYYDHLKFIENLDEALGELSPSTEIYVDMDGVLADFFGDWARLMNVDHWSDIGKENIPQALDKIRQTEDFWLELPLTSNAKNLLGIIKKLKGSYKILSSPLPDDPNSEPHKREWIKNNLDFFLPREVIITHDKAKYARNKDGTPNILIDDYGVNINAWEEAGGIGFKHKDHKFERTAKNLQTQMQQPVEEGSLRMPTSQLRSMIIQMLQDMETQHDTAKLVKIARLLGKEVYFMKKGDQVVLQDPDFDFYARENIDALVKIYENFADGKKKGKSRPGRVKRAGASCKGSVTALRKRAKNSSGEKAKMYHWCANMKSGRKK